MAVSTFEECFRISVLPSDNPTVHEVGSAVTVTACPDFVGYPSPLLSNVDMLSDSESEVESIHHLTINEHYARAFEYKKEREELQKCRFPFA